MGGRGPTVRALPHLLLLAVGFAAPASAQTSFTGLGDLAGGSIQSFAQGVSADGTTAVGYSESTTGGEAFVWTLAGGIQGLGDLPGGGTLSQAFAVSQDGGTIVGFGLGTSGLEATQWTSGAGMPGLGDLPGGSFSSIARAISADGTVVVGQGTSALSGTGVEAFRWTAAGGMSALGDLPGGAFDSQAMGISGDGATVVGRGTSASGYEAFLWTSAGGMTGLGDLPGGAFDSEARGASFDGSVITGLSNSASGIEAFRWTSAGGMVGLGDLPGGAFASQASAISADGSTIVGQGTDATGVVAIVWDAANGLRDLRAVLLGLGHDLTGWTLTNATGVSADGRVITGVGTNPSGQQEAWLAVLPGDVPTDPDRFLRFFSSVAPSHRESTQTAQAYLAAVDPEDARTTRAAWLTLNGFDTGADAEATYVNDADLGFGRHMFVKTHLDGRVASYVDNYGDDALSPDPVDGPVDEKIANAHAGVNLIATVAMEYGPPPSNPTGEFYTTFYAFDANGQRILSANLDGRGEKFLPGVCNVCHGGQPQPLELDGSYPGEGDTGAGFLPWDLETFGFTSALFGGQPLYERASQEAAFKTFNQAVLQTSPTPAARELVEGWYGGAGLPSPTFDGGFVPAGWAGHEAAYLEVFAPNCRACHVMRTPADSFDNHASFTALRDRAAHLVFDRGVMPLARRTFGRFWSGASVLDPAMIDLFGTIAATRRPANGASYPFAGADTTARMGNTVALDASESSFVSSFAWALDSVPPGSTAVLDAATGTTTSFTPDLPGEYVVRVTDADGPGTTDAMTLTATLAGGAAGVDFETEVVAVYDASCRSCHQGGVDIGGKIAPDFDGAATSPGSPEYTAALYRSFIARASVIDPLGSLLLQKSTGAISHVGGAPIGVGSAPHALLVDWISQGATRTTTPGYRKIDGSVVHPILSYTPVPFAMGGPHAYAGPTLEPGASLVGASLSLAFLNDADLDGADLSGSDLGSAELSNASFRGATLTGANLSGAQLVGAVLTDAVGVTPSQVESAATLQGALLENLDLTGLALPFTSISFVSLRGSVLVNADFTNTSLGNADLTGANLSGASLAGAGLDQAVLSSAIGVTAAQIESAASIGGIGLAGLQLDGIDLSGRSLLGADLRGASLRGATLAGTNLDFADLEGTDLQGADLTSALNLGRSIGAARYDASTDFTGTGFDPAAAGWTLVQPAPGVPVSGRLALFALIACLVSIGVARSRRHSAALPQWGTR